MTQNLRAFGTRSLLRLLLCAGLLLAPAHARADDYALPKLDNLVKTLIRFRALDPRDDRVIDTFAKIAECGVYQKHFENDFTWEKARAALRQSIQDNVMTYPTGYRYDVPLFLDRYDFKEKIYRFSNETARKQTNVFVLQAHEEDLCGSKSKQEFIPLRYKLVIDRPVQIEGLYLSQDEGELLLKRMTEHGNTNRAVYARFNLRVLYVAPIPVRNGPKDPSLQSNEKGSPTVTQSVDQGAMVMDSRLDTVEFYEDEARTKLIYSFQP